MNYPFSQPTNSDYSPFWMKVTFPFGFRKSMLVNPLHRSFLVSYRIHFSSYIKVDPRNCHFFSVIAAKFGDPRLSSFIPRSVLWVSQAFSLLLQHSSVCTTHNLKRQSTLLIFADHYGFSHHRFLQQIVSSR